MLVFNAIKRGGGGEKGKLRCECEFMSQFCIAILISFC